MDSNNYYYRLNATEKLNFKEIPEWVHEIAGVLQENGKSVFLVGGAVRDLIWGNTPFDWDLATDALPEQVENLYRKTIPTGKSYGTITVILGEHQTEITTIREDVGYSDGRRPDQVRFGTDILLDLGRRDFTINAMAYDFKNEVLIDPFRGREDCYRRFLRTVGDPAIRFQEDGLRMFRFYRFLATLNLTADRKSERAINPDWAASLSFERIREEFSKLLTGNGVSKGLSGLQKSGLLRSIIPELATNGPGVKLSQSLWEHLLSTTQNIHPLLHLRLAALLHDVAKPVSEIITETGVHFYGHEQRGAEICGKILERLRYPKKLIEKVALLIRNHMFFYQPHIGDAAVRRLIAKVGPENIADLLELRRADIVASGRVTRETWEYWQDLSGRIRSIQNSNLSAGKEKKLAVSGQDLITQFNLTPGPLVGEILAYLQEQVFELPRLNDKQRLLDLARDYLTTKNNG